MNNGRTIDYQALLDNLDLMINTMEFDSQRSAGKCKMNANNYNELVAMRETVAKKLVKKPLPKKEG